MALESISHKKSYMQTEWAKTSNLNEAEFDLHFQIQDNHMPLFVYPVGSNGMASQIDWLTCII